MKCVSFTRASLCCLIQRANPIRAVHCSISTQHKAKIPLYLRPALFKATVSEIKQWHAWAKDQVSSVGSVFEDLDNGPDSTLLLRELKWLFEDASQDHSILSPNTNHDETKSISMKASLAALYEMWNQRIEKRMPFQYIVGCEHWRDLILSVEEGVLIPRPETEMIVDLVADAVKGNEGLRNGLWADLGTGSGALSIGIARLLGPGYGKVLAVDLSQVSVAVASYNVERYNLQDKVEVRQGSWFDPLKDVKGELAGLVSNPPYIPSEDIHGLQAEVSRHEPRLALDGGTNGLNDLLHLCDGAVSFLKPGGFFAFETNGEKQSNFLLDYMNTNMKGGFNSVKIISDFAGIHRFVTGYRA